MVDPRRSAIAKRGWETQREPNEPAKRAEALRLRLEGKTWQQIADHQKVSPDKARHRVWKAEQSAAEEELAREGLIPCPECGSLLAVDHLLKARRL